MFECLNEGLEGLGGLGGLGGLESLESILELELGAQASISWRCELEFESGIFSFGVEIR
jgi:hypothetical protein